VTGQKSVVRNWRDVQPTLPSPGIEEFKLLSAEETSAKQVNASLYVIQSGSTFKPEKFKGETGFYCLAGNGILLWYRDNTNLPYLIDNDWAAWIPGSHTYQFENTGEGPMRLLAVSCLNDAEYVMRDGKLGKLDPLTPITRKVADQSYGTGVTGAKKMSVLAYQVFAPGKAQGEHWHDEEVIYLVRGEGTLVSDGQEHQLTAGSLAHNPLNIHHRLTNTGHDMFGYLVMEFKP
jgi:quercetin dioxygenase-like cupin family protein